MKKILTYIMALFILGASLVGYKTYQIKQEEEGNKKDLVSVIENTDFIENKNGKYRINRDKLNKENTALTNNGKLPRKNKVSGIIKLGKNFDINSIDALSKRTLDEQIYIINNFYLNSNNKEKANEYIDVLEKNLNENLDNLIKRDNDYSSILKAADKAYIHVGYIAMLGSGFLLLIILIKFWSNDIIY